MNGAEKIYRHFYGKRRRAAANRLVAFPEVAVLSVGNLTTGGTGKTPAVQWLARRLREENGKVAVVARGYGGKYSARGAIVADGETLLLNAREAGDEAVLHARALPGVPVVIGRDRVAAVKTAIENFAPDAVVLDDAFQYWSLARDFDLVLLDARRPFGNGKLLPAGRLREPPAELKRADGVLLTRADAATETELQRARETVEELTDAPLFRASHAPVALRDEANGACLALDVLAGQRVAALGAVADNAGFFRSLEACGVQLVSARARRDHHHWREDEVAAFARRAREQGAAALVTTEKDAVKIEPSWALPLSLYSLVIALRIENEDELWDRVRSVVARRTRVVASS